jgi:hypothetical protein
MPEPLADRLSRLTPDRAGLDRDALLFAAGRASVRPGRRWPAVAALLAASQAATLALLWLRPEPPPAPGGHPPAAWVAQSVEPPPADPALGSRVWPAMGLDDDPRPDPVDAPPVRSVSVTQPPLGLD